MYNRYYGNTGRVQRVPEGPLSPPPPPAPRPGPPRAAPVRRKPAPPPFGAGGLLQGLETEDLLLGLIFYLLYRETRDQDFLILLASLFLE